MSVQIKYRNDHEFHTIVGRIVDIIHDDKYTQNWVNKQSEKQLKYQGIDNIPEDIDSTEYQVHIDNQVRFMRDIVIAVLNEF
jgi:hypothetical protein